MSDLGTILVGQTKNLVGHHIIYHALQAGIHDVLNAQGFAMHYRTISFASFTNVMSDNGCDFVGHWQILVGHCPMTDCYLQPCYPLRMFCFYLFTRNVTM